MSLQLCTSGMTRARLRPSKRAERTAKVAMAGRNQSSLRTRPNRRRELHGPRGIVPWRKAPPVQQLVKADAVAVVTASELDEAGHLRDVVLLHGHVKLEIIQRTLAPEIGDEGQPIEQRGEVAAAAV